MSIRQITDPTERMVLLLLASMQKKAREKESRLKEKLSAYKKLYPLKRKRDGAPAASKDRGDDEWTPSNPKKVSGNKSIPILVLGKSKSAAGKKGTKRTFSDLHGIKHRTRSCSSRDAN